MSTKEQESGWVADALEGAVNGKPFLAEKASLYHQVVLHSGASQNGHGDIRDVMESVTHELPLGRIQRLNIAHQALPEHTLE